MESFNAEELKNTVNTIKNIYAETKKDDEEVIFSVSKTDFRKFMKEQGISEDVLARVSNATNLYINSALEVTKDMLLDNKNGKNSPQKAVLRTRTDIGRIDVECNAIRNGTNPKTGDKTVKYGSFSVKIRSKSHLDKEILKKCEDEIRAAFEDDNISLAA